MELVPQPNPRGRGNMVTHLRQAAQPHRASPATGQDTATTRLSFLLCQRVCACVYMCVCIIACLCVSGCVYLCECMLRLFCFVYVYVCVCVLCVCCWVSVCAPV